MRSHETILILFFAMAFWTSKAMAKVPPPPPAIALEAGKVYPANTRQDAFISEADDATAVFRNRAVLFKGWDGDGDKTQVGGAYRVYRFKISFKDPVLLREVLIRGAGDQREHALVRILDPSGTVVASGSPKSFNVLTSFSLKVDAIGSTFFLEEYDQSSVYRLRERIELVYEEPRAKKQ